MRCARLALVVVAFGLMAGCGGDEARSDPATLPDDGLPAACNPLRTAGACLFPFPSFAYLSDDPATSTGYRVSLTPEVMPVSSMGVPYDPWRLNAADGFSPSAEIIAYLPERIDPASLPSILDPAQSLSAASATLIVDMETHELVQHFAEPDAQVGSDDNEGLDRQALILRPTTRLRAGARYAVAITRSIATVGGGEPTSPPGFIAARDGRGGDPRMTDVFASLDAVGVSRQDLVLAWGFATASDEGLTGTIRAMRQRALEAVPAGGLGYAITSVESDYSDRALVRVRGTFKTPKFLTSTDRATADATLRLDESGLPAYDGTYDAPFTLIVPRSAQTGKVGLLLFGHGFLGSAESELGGPGGSHVQSFADDHGFAVIGTDWSGLSVYEGIEDGGSHAAVSALQDLNGLPFISDRLQQAVINALVLARTAPTIAHDAAIEGHDNIDTSRIDYYGISLGGVMGSALLGFSPDLERAVLNVGGAGWATLTQRSVNWALFRLVLSQSYPDKLDQQIIVDLLQTHLDPIDGLSIAPHVLRDPLPGNGTKHILLQMGLNDNSVPNAATELLARTMGLSLLDDSPVDVDGLKKEPGPLASALTVWDSGGEAPPITNEPGAAGSQVHNDTRLIGALGRQSEHFLRTGEVISTCDGVCDPD